jgi:hypothetical protein
LNRAAGHGDGRAKGDGLEIDGGGKNDGAGFLRGQEGKGVHAFEVTHDPQKRIVWKFADHALVKSITMVKVLDDE